MGEIAFGIGLCLGLISVGLVARASSKRSNAGLDGTSGRVNIGLESGGVVVVGRHIG